MEHGGDLLTYQDYYDGELIDFSSNINPLGPPEGLENEIMKGFKNVISYPDIEYRHLKSSIGDYLNCNRDNVVVGNGAMDIVNNFTLLFSRIIVFIPSFLEYEKRGLVNEKEIVRLNYKEDFTIDLNALESTIKPGDLIILGNPNNPTGLRIERELLIYIYEVIFRQGGFLLLDEAFYEFSSKDYNSIEIFTNYSFKNVGIIRAATKFFALPGLRLGYGCISKDMVEKYNKVEMPWSVNAFADIAGQFIFKDKEYIEKSKVYIEKERQFLLKELSNIEGIKPYNTHTNYILIKLLKWDEEYVFNFFLKKGLVLRKCSSFTGLDNTFIRVAIKDRENNEKLIKVFNELESL